MGAPVESRVDLTGGQEVLQLPKPRERRRVKDFLAHPDLLEHRAKLPRAARRIPAAAEIRQVLANFPKRDAIAPVIAAAVPDFDGASGKRPRDDIDDVAHSVVLAVVADIEDFAGDRFGGSLENGQNRLAN